MSSEHINQLEQVSFVEDLMNVFIRTIFTIFLWSLSFIYYGLLMSDLLGLVIIFVVMLLLLPYTIALVSQWFQIWAYQTVSWQLGKPYMNYKSKCPFLVRKRFTFSCRAEQIAPYQKNLIEKCHRVDLWEACWPERIPSILEVFDEATPKNQQQLAFILAGMKEHALPAGSKMLSVLNDTSLEINGRLSAGVALAAMKNENGIPPLLAMLGQPDQRINQTIKAVLSRYGETALPYLISAIQECEDDSQCGGIIEVIGKIGHTNTIPALEGVLNKDTTGEYSRLSAIYALQEINTEEAYEKLLVYLEHAPEEEDDVLKQVFQSHKLISFPLLIELLSNRDISEEYYAKIGDILAEVDARSYDRFFVKIRETKGLETSQRLARILKENTPEEEEFLTLQAIFDKHISYQEIL
ncbi:MAG: HEAT repeat domain-containing protein [Candidatus Hodarchaeales archaeon]|jgi:HEAT repeat protein